MSTWADVGEETHRRRGAVIGVVAVIILAAGGVTAWYYHAYHVWPGQGTPPKVHWCGRDYVSGGDPQTWRQVTSKQSFPVRAVDRDYLPLSLHQQLFAAPLPATLRSSIGTPACAVVVYLRTGRDRYQPYSLSGGP